MYYNYLKNGGNAQEPKINGVTRAQKFVDRLLDEGVKVNCEETDLCDKCELPPFYDEELFKKGQQFFYRHIFAMFFAKFNGLLAVLSAPSVLKVLMFTQKSSTDFSAYVRYMSTIFHMIIWYQDDFKPGSRLWKSLREVNKKHMYASKKSCMAGFSKITQKDMALTQFGFMGLQICRTEMVGIHNYSDEELRSFIHLWRVVGYLMGIEDRFNICRESEQETKEICNTLINRAFFPEMSKRDKNFLNMSKCLIHGMWTMSPMLVYRVNMNYLYNLMKPLDSNNNNIKDNNIVNENLFNLGFIMRIRLWYIGFVMTILLKYNIFRTIFNFLKNLSLWLMTVCPFLVYYSFGKANSIVEIKL